MRRKVKFHTLHPLNSGQARKFGVQESAFISSSWRIMMSLKSLKSIFFSHFKVLISSERFTILEASFGRDLRKLAFPYFLKTFFNKILVSSYMYPENPGGTQVTVGSMNMDMVYNYIRHCQESNSQPVPFQAGADTTKDHSDVGRWFIDSWCLSCYIQQVSSLGSGTDHVMDAVTECEHLSRGSGHTEEAAPWRMFYRKELFTPWHDPALDPVATKLVYRQIVDGLPKEEFRIPQVR